MSFDQQELIKRTLAQYTASISGACPSAAGENNYRGPAEPNIWEQEGQPSTDADEDEISAKIQQSAEIRVALPDNSDQLVDSFDSDQNEPDQPQDSKSFNSLDVNALQSLEEAIMLLPEEERHHYCKVKKEKPELIEKESNPWWYLKFEKFNMWTAAKKLTCYWYHRFKIFGDRAMLPMNQTGEGTLNKTDIQLLKTGFYAFPPPDKGGRTIIISDSSRRARKKDSETVMRVSFYLSYVLLQNPLTCTEGFVVICLLSKSTFDTASRTFSERQKMGEKCFPCVTYSVHAICKDEMALLQPLLDKAIQFCFDSLPRNKNRKYFHKRSNGSASMLQILEQEHGISPHSVPECIGGKFTHDNFCHWRERQIRIEWDLPLGVLAQEGDERELPKVRPTCELTVAERKERKRRLNILHARRRRRRDRFDANFLNGQIENLEKEKAGHQLEYARLQRLLHEAEKTVRLHEAAAKRIAPTHSATKPIPTNAKIAAKPQEHTQFTKMIMPQAVTNDREIVGASTPQYAASICNNNNNNNNNLIPHLSGPLSCTTPSPLATLMAQHQHQQVPLQLYQDQRFAQNYFQAAQFQLQGNNATGLPASVFAQQLTPSEALRAHFTMMLPDNAAFPDDQR